MQKWHRNWNFGDPVEFDEDKNYTFKSADYLPEGYGETNDFFANPEVITPSTTYIITKGHLIIQLYDDQCDGAGCRLV